MALLTITKKEKNFVFYSGILKTASCWDEPFKQIASNMNVQMNHLNKLLPIWVVFT